MMLLIEKVKLEGLYALLRKGLSYLCYFWISFRHCTYSFIKCNAWPNPSTLIDKGHKVRSATFASIYYKILPPMGMNRNSSVIGQCDARKSVSETATLSFMQQQN
jgi:hypothetical protein